MRGPGTIFHSSRAKGQSTKIWSTDSSLQEHRGHLEGPAHPLFLRLSKVRILLCRRDQQKKSTFGREGKFQRVFQRVGSGGAQGIAKIAGSQQRLCTYQRMSPILFYPSSLPIWEKFLVILAEASLLPSSGLEEALPGPSSSTNECHPDSKLRYPTGLPGFLR